MQALLVCQAFLIYKQYLEDHNLEDDSFTISSRRVVAFVDEMIDEDQKAGIIARIKTQTPAAFKN